MNNFLIHYVVMRSDFFFLGFSILCTRRTRTRGASRIFWFTSKDTHKHICIQFLSLCTFLDIAFETVIYNCNYDYTYTFILHSRSFWFNNFVIAKCITFLG